MKLDVTLLEKMEGLVRSGELKAVKALLGDISVRGVPRPLAFKIANISRRIGYHRFALRVLNPIIYPTKPLQISPTDEEFIEYAVNLMRIGIIGESLKLLEKVKNKKNPEVLLYKAFCWVAMWEHEKAIPLISEYLKSDQITDYQRLVAKVNQGAYYVNLFQFASAEKIINDVIKNLKLEEHKLLAGYAYQTLAEISTHRRKFQKAKAQIAESEKYFQSEHYRYTIYNKQLLAIGSILTKNTDINYLYAVKEEARKKKLWEVCRELEAYEAIAQNNVNHLIELKFGTPFPKFRERIDKLVGREVILPKFYNWYPKGKPEKTNHILDVVLGRDLSTGSELKKGSLLHKLLEVFCSDFYRPFKNEVLFTKMFPDDYYHPLYSLPKVAALIVRLRKWFRENNIPIEIHNVSRGEFQLTLLKPYGIKISLFLQPQSRDDIFLNNLKNKFKKEWFSCQLAVAETGLSRATCKRYIRTAVNNNILISDGFAQYRKYRFSS